MSDWYCHTSRYSINFLLILFILGPTVLAKNCADVCGREDEPNSDIFYHDELSQCMKEDGVRRMVKLVNGYPPPKRGWMVMLRIFPSYNMEEYETCSGALLNKRFVVSAAHCVILMFNLNINYFYHKHDY